MTAQEIAQQTEEVQGTLAVLHAGLSEAMGVIRTQPLEVDVTVSHANRSYVVRKPNPALRRVREISAAIRTLEQHLKKLRVEESALAKQKELDDSPWAKLKAKS